LFHFHFCRLFHLKVFVSQFLGLQPTAATFSRTLHSGTFHQFVFSPPPLFLSHFSSSFPVLFCWPTIFSYHCVLQQAFCVPSWGSGLVIVVSSSRITRARIKTNPADWHPWSLPADWHSLHCPACRTEWVCTSQEWTQ